MPFPKNPLFIITGFQKKTAVKAVLLIGTRTGIRTLDPLIKSQLL